MARQYSMVQLDVFASRPMEGNPLAVFFDGRGLSDSEMQALAREMNLSETTFILPRDPPTEGAQGAQGVRVRIFTVEEEVPFAGHPTLGTAFAIRGSTGASEVVLELGVGNVPVRFEDPARPSFGEMTQKDPVFGEIHNRETVAGVLGVAADALDPALPIQTVTTGLPFTVVPFHSRLVLARLKLDLGRVDEYLAKSGSRHFFLVSRDVVDPAARLHARMLFYGGEDPATGSAAGCAAAWMVAHAVARPDKRVFIEQGLEINRPSRIEVRASRTGDRVHDVRVGGEVVEIMRGVVTIE